MCDSEANDRAPVRTRLDWGPFLSKVTRSILGISKTTELVLLAAADLMKRLSRRLETDGGRARPDLEKRFGEGTRDIVEEASWESFPASDAPPR
jgi:hypothetical protein